MKLFRAVPAVRGKALQVQMAVQQQIARELHAAFPGELDRVGAAALAVLTGLSAGDRKPVVVGGHGLDGETPLRRV